MTVFGGKAPELDADAIPARTTPTWEMELLLSGATVFGLLQAPGYLNELTDPLFARLGSDYAFVARTLIMYLAAAVYALLATFILHLLVRGVWIAAVGVRSMFPDGPDLAKLRGGPISRRVAAEMPSLTNVIDRLDNLATTVFALGAITVMGALISAAVAIPAFSVDVIAESQFGQRDSHWSLIVIALLFAPLAVAATIDLFGAKLAPSALPARAAAFIYRCYRRFMSPTFMTVLLNTLMTRLGTLRVLGIYLVALTGLMLLVSVQMRSRTGSAVLGDYSLLPAPRSAFVVQPFHYLDQRHAGHAARLDPYIESMQPQSDWLRVYLPFDGGRHGVPMSASCPEPVPTPPAIATANDASSIDADVSARLRCLAVIYGLRIDGAPPVHVDYSLYVDPDSGVRGMLAMADIAAVARGRHVVQVHWHPTRRDLASERVQSEFRIPFWR